MLWVEKFDAFTGKDMFTIGKTVSTVNEIDSDVFNLPKLSFEYIQTVFSPSYKVREVKVVPQVIVLFVVPVSLDHQQACIFVTLKF